MSNGFITHLNSQDIQDLIALHQAIARYDEASVSYQLQDYINRLQWHFEGTSKVYTRSPILQEVYPTFCQLLCLCIYENGTKELKGEVPSFQGKWWSRDLQKLLIASRNFEVYVASISKTNRLIWKALDEIEEAKRHNSHLKSFRDYLDNP